VLEQCLADGGPPAPLVQQLSWAYKHPGLKEWQYLLLAAWGAQAPLAEYPLVPMERLESGGDKAPFTAGRFVAANHDTIAAFMATDTPPRPPRGVYQPGVGALTECPLASGTPAGGVEPMLVMCMRRQRCLLKQARVCRLMKQHPSLTEGQIIVLLLWTEEAMEELAKFSDEPTPPDVGGTTLGPCPPPSSPSPRLGVDSAIAPHTPLVIASGASPPGLKPRGNQQIFSTDPDAACSANPPPQREMGHDETMGTAPPGLATAKKGRPRGKKKKKRGGDTLAGSSSRGARPASPHPPPGC